MIDIRADFSGAEKKMQALFRLEGATKRLLTKALGETIRRAQYNASRSILTARTGHLKRNIGGKVQEVQPGLFEISIGTGNLIGKTEVKYAAIHEFGGEIKAKRYWRVHTSGFGREGKFVKKLCFKTRDGKWHMVDKVRIPARHWLSRSIQESEGYFRSALAPQSMLREINWPDTRED